MFKKILSALKEGTLLRKTKAYFSLKIAIIFYHFFPPAIQNDKIVFDNVGGNGFGGRPAIIAEELLSHNVNAQYIWLAREKPRNLPPEIKWVPYGTGAAIREWSTAHIWIDNFRTAKRPSKREGQYYIQTWHGTAGLKKSEKLAEDKLSHNYLDAAKKDGEFMDLALAGCTEQLSFYETSFWYTGKVLLTEFYGVQTAAERKETRDRVNQFLNIPPEKNIILYAPTFRNNTDFDYFNLDFNKLRKTAEKKYGGEWCVVVRLHPNRTWKKYAFTFDRNVINGTLYPNSRDLIYSSELMISDYSSIIFDAMRCGVRALIYAPDYEEYNLERGVSSKIKTIPAPFSVDEETLAQNISCFDDTLYERECKLLNESIGYVSDRKNLDNVIEIIRALVS